VYNNKMMLFFSLSHLCTFFYFYFSVVVKKEKAHQRHIHIYVSRKNPRFLCRFAVLIFFLNKQINTYSPKAHTYIHPPKTYLQPTYIKKDHKREKRMRRKTTSHQKRTWEIDGVKRRKTSTSRPESTRHAKRELNHGNRASFDTQIADHLTGQAELRLTLFAKELHSILDEKTHQNLRSKTALQKLQGVFQTAWKQEIRIRNESDATFSEMKSNQSEARRVVNEMLKTSNDLLKRINNEIKSLKSQVKRQVSMIDEEIRARLESL